MKNFTRRYLFYLLLIGFTGLLLLYPSRYLNPKINEPNGSYIHSRIVNSDTNTINVVKSQNVLATSNALQQPAVSPKDQLKASSPIKLVIRLAKEVSLEKVAQSVDAEIVRRGPLGFATLQFKESVDKVKKIAQLKQTTGVLSVEENHKVQVQGTTVSDPYYQQQWSLSDTNVQNAWDLGATGQGITIAIVDTGVDLNHPDLKDNIVAGYNAITDSTTPGANQDDNGHGTHVAGIAAAERNSFGVVGVAYQAKIMPIKVMDASGEGYDDTIAAGIVWAADHGAQIINLSLGSDTSSEILQQAVTYAVDIKGCLIVAAAGNYDYWATSNPGVSYPAADPHVIAVSATNQNNGIAPFSCTGSQVALAAPGVNIESDFLGATVQQESGTSMASPFVAGEAALIWGQHPNWNRQQVIGVLEAGVKDLGSPGRDSSFGYGRVDIGLALKLANPLATYQSLANVDSSGANVESSDSNTQVVLTVQPQALNSPASVSIKNVALPASLPNGNTELSSAEDIVWSGATFREIANLEIADSRIASVSNSQATLYRWDGSRWITVGGLVSEGQINLGIFIPGIYVAGTRASITSPDRLAGWDAEGTAIQISKTAFPTGADTVIIATDLTFPDALAGAPLAYKYQAPILLTPKDEMPQEIRNEIARLAPKKIYLLGGTSVISQGIEDELIRQNYEVKRLSGYTCYGTSQAIANELDTIGKAVVASGEQFPDALAISAWAAQQGEPVLLTAAKGLPAETQQALNDLSISQTQIIGGQAVVSNEVMLELPLPSRLSGLTQYDTAVEVLNHYPPRSNEIYLATGENYPDALTGSVLVAQRGSMLITVPTTSQIPNNMLSLFGSWQGKSVTTFGGVVAMPQTVVQTVQNQLK